MNGSPTVYRPLSEIVSEALLDSGEGIHWTERYTRWALKYAEEIFSDWAPNVVTKPMDLKPWLAIELPPDCLTWLTVGIQNGSDIMTFINDRTIAQNFTKDSDGVKQANLKPQYGDDFTNLSLSDTVVPFFNFTNNLTDLGENPGKLFGLMVKDNGLGYFTENKNKDVNEIQFKFRVNRPNTKIYLQYQTTGLNATGETMIHPDYAEYIIQGIHRERQSKSRDKSGLGWTEEEFKRQSIRMLDKKWSYSTEDIIEYLRSGYGSYPKK